MQKHLHFRVHWDGAGRYIMVCWRLLCSAQKLLVWGCSGTIPAIQHLQTQRECPSPSLAVWESVQLYPSLRECPAPVWESVPPSLANSRGCSVCPPRAAAHNLPIINNWTDHLKVKPSYSAVQCSALQCSVLQCIVVQCSAVQCRAVQCSAAGSFVSGPRPRATASHTVQLTALHWAAHWQCSAVQCLVCSV